MTPSSSSAIDRLLAIMARLRAPEGGCPWDIEQRFETIAPYTIEEAYEVVDAIERGDRAALKDELGDLLFQVVFHAQIAAEEGAFSFEDVAQAVVDKMIRRHPHVFGARSDIASAADQTRAWEETKAAERAKAAGGAQPSALDGVARGLPAMLRAIKIQKRAARVGFDWAEAEPILDKIAEEIDELRAELGARNTARIEEEAGDLLFAMANLMRRLDLDPEIVLGRATAKFERRFRAMEALAAARGQRFQDLGLADQEALWTEIKQTEA